MVSIYHASTREAEEGGLGIQGQLGSCGKTLVPHPTPSKSSYQNEVSPWLPQQWYFVYNNELLQSQNNMALPHYPENGEPSSDFSSLYCGLSDITHMN